MNIAISPAPVRRSVRVNAPPARAFEAFTAGIHRWWPASHSVGASPQRSVAIEPRAGDRWYETGEDGSECPWGHVLAWEPPGRVLLAWQIDARWKYDPELVTELEVRFTPDGADATRVDLEHRHLERFGDAAETVRGSLDSPGGWPGLLDLYAKAAEG